MDTSPKHFLIVEDDNGHADLISMALHAEDDANTIDRVSDGEQALEYVQKKGQYANSRRPDLILLDLKLPKIDGHQVIHFIKNHPDLRRIPVVVLTTSGNENDKRRAYESHVNSYLVKPFVFEDFHELVRQLQAYWCHWNQSSVQAVA